MEYKLGKFIVMWDEAALEIYSNEFLMMSLMEDQKVTNADGSSILDNITFDGGMTINVSDTSIKEANYFKAPWDD